ncbi:MAG: hypothetical protein NTV51_02780 [Verrucomicrobia bacterium]|nr:hypothetical protein [Verrucomicrobiota bacterium]
MSTTTTRRRLPLLSFSTEAYVRAHGRLPRGFGRWFFENSGRLYGPYTGTLSEAKAEFRSAMAGKADLLASCLVEVAS